MHFTDCKVSSPTWNAVVCYTLMSDFEFFFNCGEEILSQLRVCGQCKINEFYDLCVFFFKLMKTLNIWEF